MNLLWTLVIWNTSLSLSTIQEGAESNMSSCNLGKLQSTSCFQKHLLVLSNNRLVLEYKSGILLSIPDVTWWNPLQNISLLCTNARKQKEISNIDHSKRQDQKAGNRLLPSKTRLYFFTQRTTCCRRFANFRLRYTSAQRYKISSDVEHNHLSQRPKQNTGYRLLLTDSRAYTGGWSSKNNTQFTSSRLTPIWQNGSLDKWLNIIHMQNISIKLTSVRENGTLNEWLAIIYLIETFSDCLVLKIMHFICVLLFSFWTNGSYDKRLTADHMQSAYVLFISETYTGPFETAGQQNSMEDISEKQYFMEDISDQQYPRENISYKRYSKEDICDKHHYIVNISDQNISTTRIRVKTLQCCGLPLNRTTNHNFASVQHNRIMKNEKMLQTLNDLEEEMQRMYSLLHYTRSTYLYIVLKMNKCQLDGYSISHKPAINTDGFIACTLCMPILYCIIFCLKWICFLKSSSVQTFYFKLTANKTISLFMFQASNIILNNCFYISVYFPHILHRIQKTRNDFLQTLFPIVSPKVRKTIVRRYRKYERDIKRTKVKRFFEYYVRWMKAFDLKQKYSRSANIGQTCLANRRRKNPLRGGRKRKRSYRKSGVFSHGKSLYKRKSSQRTSKLRRAFKMFITSSQNSLKNAIQSTQSIVTKTGKVAGDAANNIRDLFRLRWFPQATSTVMPFIGSSVENEFLRVATYSTFPTRAVSTLGLARAGFFYTGRSDVVECFHCHIQHGNWEINDIPFEMHRRISPSCDFILGNETENISIDRSSTQSEPCTSPPSVVRRAQSRNGETNVQGTLNSGESQTSSSSYATTGSEHTSAYLSTESESCEELYSDSIGFSNQCTETSLSTIEQEERGSLHQISTISSQTGSAATNQHSEYRHTNGISSAEAEPKIQNKRSDDTKIEKTTNSQTRHVAAVQLKPISQCNDRPKHIAYAVITVRMSSFKGWSSHTGQTPRELAAAGLFYSGCGDLVRCWFCGVGLQSWETDDDPWIEHAKWAPTCVFLRRSKGDEFIQLVHERNNLCSHSNSASNTEETSFTCIQNSQEEIQTPLHLAASVERVKAMGYSTGVIQEVIETLQRDNTPIDTNSIVNELMENEENYFRTNPDRVKVSELTWNTATRAAEVGSCSNGLTEGMRKLEIQETNRLLEENRRLRQELKCKICMDTDAVITFIPCGHMICCEECGFAVSKCPVCRRAIETRVKTWMS